MSDALLAELLAARQARRPCVVATIAATTGSVPRSSGSKMLVYADGKTSGTIGGGKFEALVVEEALATLRRTQPLLKTYPLHEGQPDSFGAICGGEVTVLIEPQVLGEAIYLIGGGHCAKAIARLAIDSGFFVSVIEDRAESLEDLPPNVARITEPPPAFIAAHAWHRDEALVIVSRNHEIDREALAAAVEQTGAGYIGMIGSKRKVRLVFEKLRERGVAAEKLARVYAPIGLDIGADSPAEIAISAMAEIIAVLRSRSAGHMRVSKARRFDGVPPGKYAAHMPELVDPPLKPAEKRDMPTVQSPINLKKWIEENRHLFKPPVSNRYLYDGRDFFVMVIVGPNARNDFHLVDSEEYFYQLEGDIKVRIREGDHLVDHLVREGDTFFIPPNVPHAPVRPPNTIGVVVERRRPAGEREHVIFYCDNCEAVVQDIDFDCGDIVEHFSQAMLDFWNDDERRTCKKCGHKVQKPEPVKPF